jgi:hypothetical protein
MKNRDRFENAHQFLGGYFHPDWGDDYNEPEEVVAQFIKDTHRQTRINVLRELREIIAEFQGPDLDRIILSIGCFYSPERYRGITMRDWLEAVIAELENSLNE